MSKIPKIIHYFWTSDNEMPELVKDCINSWKNRLPDYEIKRWSTENFNVNICQYTREAFEAKKYAFVSDYVRIYVLYHEGGIYLDTDVEVVRKLDDLLNDPAFAGFENNHTVATCMIGSEKGNPIFKRFLDYYAVRTFVSTNGGYNLTPNPIPFTDICQQEGLVLNGRKQKLKNIVVYPQDYFCPYDNSSEQLKATDNTYAIHYFNGAWISEKKKMIIDKRKRIIQKYGKNIGYIYYGLGVLRTEGIKSFLQEFIFYIKR